MAACVDSLNAWARGAPARCSRATDATMARPSQVLMDSSPVRSDSDMPRGTGPRLPRVVELHSGREKMVPPHGRDDDAGDRLAGLGVHDLTAVRTAALRRLDAGGDAAAEQRGAQRDGDEQAAAHLRSGAAA